MIASYGFIGKKCFTYYVTHLHFVLYRSCSNYEGESNEEWFCSSCTKAKTFHSEAHIPNVAHKDNVNEFPFHST